MSVSLRGRKFHYRFQIEGEKYHGVCPVTLSSNPSGREIGYVNWSGAVKYTGLSKSTLVRMMKLGKLKPPHKVGTGKNGAALFAKSDLDNFIQSA